MQLRLSGKRILVTREANQAKSFASKIIENGGQPTVVPLLNISCIHGGKNHEMLQRLSNFEWIFFSSVNGVDCFFSLLESSGIRLSDVKLAAVGQKTGEAIKRYGYEVDFFPTIYDGENLAKEFIETYKHVGRILLIQGSRSRDVIYKGLVAANINVETFVVYQTVYNESVKEELKEVIQGTTFDFITFTSPSCVEAFYEFLEGNVNLPLATKIVCIGKTTAERARELGMEDTIIPKTYTINGMIDCMCQTDNRED